ncbi:MAG: hypothetical protein Q9212_001963 [Teloschistes hypoglaucus]
MSDGAGRNGANSAKEHGSPLTAKALLDANLSTKRPSTVGSSIIQTQWNTSHLSSRTAADAASAACAAGLVAPLITILDRGIIENASGRSKLLTSISTSFRALFTRPHIFLASRPFRLISLVYFSTYFVANSIDTISSTLTPSSIAHTTSGPSKFLATSSVNMSLCLYKDSQFAQMFGAAAACRNPMPKASYALFALRDCLTVFASFNLPPLVAPLLSDKLEKVASKASAAQILVPAAMQIVSTPLHLWGLDLYNRPSASMSERIRQVGRNWVGSTAARMGRIVPAFGFGGVINSKVRRRLMATLDEPAVE